MKYVLLVANLLIATHSVDAQELLSLQDAIAIGLQNSHNIRIAANERDIAENNFTRGNAGFLPVVSWNGGRNYSRQNVNQEFINGSMNEKNGATSNTWSTGVDLRWTLFDGMRMFRTYDRLDALRGLSALDEELQIEDAIFAIALAYYDVVLQAQRANVFDTTLQLSGQRVALSQVRYELGKAPKLDYLSAMVDYNTDSSALVVQQEALTRARQNLNHVMGRDIDTELITATEITLDSTLSHEAILSRALSANTALRRLERNSAILQLESEEIKAERLPSVDLNLGYAYNNLSSQAGFLLSNRTNGLNYGLSATWTLFNGNDIMRRQENTLILLDSNRERIAQLRLQIERDVESAWLDYENSQKLENLERASLEVALETAAIARDRYNLGKATFLELREAQVNTVRVASRLFDAQYNMKVAELELLRLSGSIIQ
ncbi:MAG: TolC family protein [Saprospiraceae bacterium]|nr:TolC family protein [Saprospiraceae bacterium]